MLGAGHEGEARKHKGKARVAARKRRRAQTEQLPGNCCSSNSRSPGKGKNLQKCCYIEVDVSGKNFTGANLCSANFTGADAAGANFQSANLGGAVFCRTTMPDGSVNDSGCDRGNRCCQTCIEADEDCGDGIGGAVRRGVRSMHGK